MGALVTYMLCRFYLCLGSAAIGSNSPIAKEAPLGSNSPDATLTARHIDVQIRHITTV